MTARQRRRTEEGAGTPPQDGPEPTTAGAELQEEAPGGEGAGAGGGDGREVREALEVKVRELRRRLSEAEAEAEGLRSALEQATRDAHQARREAQEARDALKRALARVRELLLESAPEVPPEMVRGDSLRALEESFRSAHRLVERIRAEVESRLARERVPLGAPVRRAPDAHLTPREKILYALRRRG